MKFGRQLEAHTLGCECVAKIEKPVATTKIPFIGVPAAPKNLKDICTTANPNCAKACAPAMACKAQTVLKGRQLAGHIKNMGKNIGSSIAKGFGNIGKAIPSMGKPNMDFLKNCAGYAACAILEKNDMKTTNKPIIGPKPTKPAMPNKCLAVGKPCKTAGGKMGVYQQKKMSLVGDLKKKIGTITEKKLLGRQLAAHTLGCECV